MRRAVDKRQGAGGTTKSHGEGESNSSMGEIKGFFRFGWSPAAEVLRLTRERLNEDVLLVQNTAQRGDLGGHSETPPHRIHNGGFRRHRRKTTMAGEENGVVLDIVYKHGCAVHSTTR